ncbi:MAG TPA: YcnI family protein [Acidimicrobiia bacterium]|nr:YcnI family protein [Acidimicrobiia bacterium]
MLRRVAVIVATTSVALVLFAGPAWAHVKVEPASAPKGSDAVLAFVVPNEKDNATTTKVTVQFPTDHPIAEALVEAMPGWTAQTTPLQLPAGQQIQTDDGPVSTGVKSVTWTATDGKGITQDHFAEFRVSVGLPDDADTLAFPTIQTYSDASTVDWTQVTPPGGPEPDNPEPVLTLTAADNATTTPAATTTASKDDVDNAKTIAIIAIIIGALGLIAGVGGVLLGRRKTT